MDGAKAESKRVSSKKKERLWFDELSMKEAETRARTRALSRVLSMLPRPKELTKSHKNTKDLLALARAVGRFLYVFGHTHKPLIQP